MRVLIQYKAFGGFDVFCNKTDKIIGTGDINEGEIKLKDFITGKTDLEFKTLTEVVDYYFSLKPMADN